MDITFSATQNPRTALSLISHNLITSSQSSSPNLRSIRRQFFGCGRNLRPTSARTRKKCRSLGFQTHPCCSSRFVFRASMNSHTVVVCVAVVVTLSIISFAYMSYVTKRKKNKLEEGSGPSNLTSSQWDNDSGSHAVVSQVLVSEDLDEVTSQKESKDLMDRKIDTSKVREDSEAPIHFQEVVITNEESFVNKVSEPTFEDNPSSRAHGSVSNSELPQLLVQNNLCAVYATTENLSSELNTLGKPNHVLGEDVESSHYSGFFEDPGREELHTFYEENQHVKNSIPNINGLNKLSSNASVMEGNALNSNLACYKEVSLHKRKYTDDSLVVQRLRDKGRSSLPKESPHFGENHYSSLQLSLYNQLLRDGRLIDCIEVLEDMERLNLLDMDKVYHARFFKTCKTKKAVKEAFRFTKLISSPALSTFNMLLSVCASAQDSEGAFEVLKLVQKAGLKADCKLYTTLISSCAKSGKVDAMFQVFHEMVNANVEPNLHTYGTLIDGCARAGQVAKAFGAYGILRSKNVKPDRVVFNALITACGQAGALDRAFDVLAEMKAEAQPIDPDHVTVGALIKACAKAGRMDQAQDVYKMIHKYNIKGTPEVYTIAVNICSQTGNWEFARDVYNDMIAKGVVPDEMFFSALVDVAGHAGELDAAFEVLREARMQGRRLGIVSYSSLMGACSKAKNWEKALRLYEDIMIMRLNPTVPTMNALLTALCDGDQLQKALEVLSEMKKAGLWPNTITYSVLLVASEKKDDLEVGLNLYSQAKEDGLAPNLFMSQCLICMCLRRFEKACTLGEPVLSFDSGLAEIKNKWTSLALMIHRETLDAGVTPSMETFSKVLGCLQLPREASLRNRLIENLGVSDESTKCSNIPSLITGFGEYDPRAFSLLEEAASLGIVPCVSFKESPIVIDARTLQIHTAEVYILTVLKSLKHRHAAGAKLPSVSIILPVEKTKIPSPKGEKTVNIAGRIGQAVSSCLRRLGLPYQGSESFGKIRINGLSVKRWFQPKHASPFREFGSSPSRLRKGISFQQRDIRTESFSLQ